MEGLENTHTEDLGEDRPLERMMTMNEKTISVADWSTENIGRIVKSLIRVATDRLL